MALLRMPRRRRSSSRTMKIMGIPVTFIVIGLAIWKWKWVSEKFKEITEKKPG